MAGIAGFGAELLLSDGAAAPGYNLVANVTNIGGPSLALDVEDVTSHESTGGWEEVIATILRTGEVTLDINYDPASWMHRIGTGAGLAITAVSIANDTVTVAGDYHLLFTPGLHFRISGSTGNNGSWEVESSVFGAATVISVVGDITNAVADGTVIVTTLPMAQQGRVLVNCILRFPDVAATEWTFSTYVTKFEPGAPFDGKMTASVSLKLTGVPVLV
jgi:predicted secreted protein